MNYMRLGRKIITYLFLGITVLFLIIITVFFISYYKMKTCEVSDSDAIGEAINFVEMLSIPYKSQPIIKYDHDLQSLKEKGKMIKYHLGNYMKLILELSDDPVKKKVVSFEDFDIEVGCESKEVVSYYNHHVIHRVSNRFNLFRSDDYRSLRGGQPEFINKQEAQDIVNKIISRIKMPSGMVFKSLKKDQKGLMWRAYWKREKNGYQYKEDILSIGIIGMTGDFVSFYKKYWGSDCPTEVKITKDEALRKGFKILESFHNEDEWKSIAGDFDLTGVELMIVQPQLFFFKMPSPFKSRDSRLAWVIKYKQRWASPTEHRSYENTEIWIDAQSGKLLGAQ